MKETDYRSTPLRTASGVRLRFFLDPLVAIHLDHSISLVEAEAAAAERRRIAEEMRKLIIGDDGRSDVESMWDRAIRAALKVVETDD